MIFMAGIGMKNLSVISKLLHKFFGENAICAAAIGEQLEDVRYCSKHRMNHLNGGSEKDKWEETMKKAEMLAGQDGTFTVENMKKFQVAVNEYLRKNPNAGLYDGLSETERFAVRRFYYFNCH